MEDLSNTSAPVVGDLVEIVAPGCGKPDECECELHRYVGRRARIERIQTAEPSGIPMYFLAGITPAWYDDELAVISLPVGDR